MKKDVVVLWGLLIFVSLILLYSLYYTSVSPAIPAGSQGDSTGSSGDGTWLNPISSGSTAQGDVSIELAPVSMANGRLELRISANTHSVDLGKFDLKNQATLEYGGLSVSPEEAPALGGHHSGGMLVFRMDEGIESFAVRIKGIPKVSERIFEWRVKS